MEETKKLWSRKAKVNVDFVSFHARFCVITHVDIKKNSLCNEKGEHEKNEYAVIHCESGVSFLSFNRKMWELSINFGRSHEVIGKVKNGNHGLYLLAEKIRLEDFDERTLGVPVWSDGKSQAESPLYTGATQ
jgi:hypothetical protein